MAEWLNAPVLKTGVRKDSWVRIPPPPLRCSTTSESQKTKVHVEYQNDPIGFAVDHLGIREETLRWSLDPAYANHVWDGTPDPIVAIAEALVEWKDVGVESATGTGKSHTLGWATLWFDAVWPGARVFSFAAKAEQLDLYAWTEIKKLWPAFTKTRSQGKSGPVDPTEKPHGTTTNDPAGACPRVQPGLSPCYESAACRP